MGYRIPSMTKTPTMKRQCKPIPYWVEKKAHARAEREDPHNQGHPLRGFSLKPFMTMDSVRAWACAENRQWRNSFTAHTPESC